MTLKQENSELKAHVNSLREALAETTQYYPIEVVECRGDKCRLPNCMSCCDEKSAIEASISSTQLAIKVERLFNSTPTQSLAEHDRKLIAEFRAKCEEAGHIVINQHTGEKYFSVFENTAFGYFPVYTLPPIDNEEK